MRRAVLQFADSLEAGDQCAVVVILSHGADGILYGSDGDGLHVKYILQCFDKTNCKEMDGKPKLVILQSCQSCEYYEIYILFRMNIFNMCIINTRNK